jgi:hypothetical protein
MRWDLGIAGVMLLAAMAATFGLLAQLVAGRHVTKWMWLIGASSYFVFGLLISEWWFGWATEEELQPNYDGLSFDEVLLLTLWPSIVVIAIVRRVLRHLNRSHASAPSLPQAAHGRARDARI